MKSFTVSVFLCLSFSLPVLTQPNEFNVKGVKVGTLYKQVIKKLGRPTSTRKGGEYPCESGPITTLRYPGLKIELIPSHNEKSLFVASMEVTSSKWLISSKIRIGARVEKVMRAFGNIELKSDGNRKYLPYYIGDGYAPFYFHRNRLLKAKWELNSR